MNYPAKKWSPLHHGPRPCCLDPRAPSERCVNVGEKDCSTAPMRRSWAQDKAGISRCSSAQSCMAYRISPCFSIVGMRIDWLTIKLTGCRQAHMSNFCQTLQIWSACFFPWFWIDKWSAEEKIWCQMIHWRSNWEKIRKGFPLNKIWNHLFLTRKNMLQGWFGTNNHPLVVQARLGLSFFFLNE